MKPEQFTAGSNVKVFFKCEKGHSKGYSIYKECMDLKEQTAIKEELFVRPYIPKSPIQPPSFPIYRESPNKLYIPRHFGMDTYGEPDEIRLAKGDDIHIPFDGELRDYQTNIVNIIIYAIAYLNIGKSIYKLIKK